MPVTGRAVPGPGPLCATVLAVCAAAAARGVPELRAAVEPIGRSLTEPLRVAVLGSVNAGKSTLVNAFVGRSVAPTRATECTRLVTAYRYAVTERVEVHLQSGGVRTLPLTRSGGLPDELGVPTEQVDHLEVLLSQHSLQALTLVDTPGLGSLHDETSDRTAALVGAAGGGAVAAGVDAVIAVFSTDLRTVEAEALQRFRASSGTGGAQSAVNAFGVLSKADLLGGPRDDPWPEAEALAREFAGRMSGQLSGVLPVAGLLAETVAVGAFTETDADDVAALAALPAAERSGLLRSRDRFTGRPAPVPTAARVRLWQRLSGHGLQIAIHTVDSGHRGATAITQALQQASRIGPVRDRLLGQFARRADALKAGSALNRLEHLAYDRALPRAERLWLADTVEAARLRPHLHRLVELQAVTDLAAGDADLPAPLAAALLALADSDDPAQRLGLPPGSGTAALLARAGELSDEFRLFAFGAASRDEQVALVGHRACQLLIDAVTEAAPSAPEERR